MSGFVTPIRNLIPTPTDHKPDHDKKSGDDLLTYRSGAGFLAAPNNRSPVVFKSLGNLLAYWEFVSFDPSSGRPVVYSLNGVHPSTAVCVCHLPLFQTDPKWAGLGGQWALYMEPDAARHAWYYLTVFLKAAPGINMGPAVKGLKAVSHVAIVNNPGHLGSPDNKYHLTGGIFFGCVPDMKKLTRC
jgi:hypothetical protein